MATAQGDVPFEANGMGYAMRYGANALSTLETRLDMGVNEIIATLSDSPRIGVLITMLWAGLLKRHPDMTDAQAGDIIDDLGFARAVELVAEAFSAAFPADKGDGANPPKAPAVPGRRRGGTGSPS